VPKLIIDVEGAARPGRGAVINVHQTNNFALGVRAEVRNEIAAQLPNIAAAARAAVADARMRGNRT
jgi:hypothetical protein